MGWVYFAIALVVLGVNDYIVYKYGQKVVLKAFEEFHLLTTTSLNIRADFASFFKKIKADFHL